MRHEHRPAQTRMMHIVHQALRRDLERAITALTATPPPADRQRRAIAEHLGWMMAFLHAHHELEDAGFFPVIRERRPDAAALLEAMDDDHGKIAPSITSVEAAASAYRTSDAPSVRAGLLAAIGELTDVLLPHLRREEDEVMPIAADVITGAEWRAIEHQHAVTPKPVAQLAREGHWLIDDAGAQDRAEVLGLVAAVPRFVLLHGYGRSYRRLRDACWRPAGGARRVQKHGHNEVVVNADADAVWNVVIDVPRVGEWSHECTGISFLGDATRAEPGARFRGRNRQGIFRWGRVCEVLSTDGHELVWRTVPTRLNPDSSIWRIRVSPTEGGTCIEQRFDVVRVPRILDLIYARMIPAHRDRAAALTDDLRRLGALAASTTTERTVSAS